MTEALRETVRWVWWIVAIADCMAALLAWQELSKKPDRFFTYLGHTQIGDAWGQLRTIIGLYLFGLNVQSHLWFLFFGLAAAIYQGYATVCFLLYVRGVLNGDGGWSTFKGWLRRKWSQNKGDSRHETK